MKCILFILVFIFNINGHCQKPLHIGDTLPNICFSTAINYTAPEAQLDDFKGKWLLLDFWATWCSSCQHKLPFLDSIQQLPGQPYRVLLVGKKSTIDTKERVRAFFQAKQKTNAFATSLPAIVGDTILNKYFPHSFIPFYVVLDDKLVIRALVNSEDMDRKILLSLLPAAQNIQAKNE